MDQPLGNEVGNANEVQEAIAVLKGEGPDDLRELSLQLAAEMVVLAKIEPDLDRSNWLLTMPMVT